MGGGIAGKEGKPGKGEKKRKDVKQAEAGTNNGKETEKKPSLGATKISH